MPNTSLPLVRIRASRGSSDCDCCGWYDHGSARIELPDGRVLEACHDGHFGSGCWSGTDEQLYFWTLQGLGFEVRVNGEPLTERLYMERDGCGDWHVVPLHEGTATVIDLIVQTMPDPEAPEYDVPVSVSWQSPDGRSTTLEADPTGRGAWNGDTDMLYEHLLRERARLEMF